MSLYEASVRQMNKMLGQLDKWLETGVAHAGKKSFDPAVLLSSRLAPDQYALTRQVQAACDAAKFAGARLTGKEAPKNPDTEQTLDELRARIQSTKGFLDGLVSADFAGTEGRVIELPFLEGKVLSAQDYLVDLALPNFYFHVTTAYAILRHNGVNLGKLDFLGSINARAR